MTSTRAVLLTKTLRAFLTEASQQPGLTPKRLLRALRTVALADAEDDDEPNDVPVEKVILLAAQKAAFDEPHQPLDQKKHRDLLWTWYQRLSRAGLGKGWIGRRGSPTRFRFTSGISCSDLKWAFDELGLTGVTLPARERVKRVADAATPSAPVAPEPAPAALVERERVLTLLRDHREELHGLGVLSLMLFGSVARNEARADSDVDLIATFQEPITSDAFFAAKFFLEDLLGRRVDLITESSLRERVRRVIEPELIRVA